MEGMIFPPGVPSCPGYPLLALQVEGRCLARRMGLLRAILFSTTCSRATAEALQKARGTAAAPRGADTPRPPPARAG